MENNLLIYKKYTDLYFYAYNLLEKYPKAEKFALVTDIKKSMNNVVRNMFYAQKVDNNRKWPYLNSIDAELLFQRFATRLSYNKKYISPNNYKTWSAKIAEIGRMLGGWMRTCPRE